MIKLTTHDGAKWYLRTENILNATYDPGPGILWVRLKGAKVSVGPVTKVEDSELHDWQNLLIYLTQQKGTVGKTNHITKP